MEAALSDPRIKTATGPTILLHSGHYFDLLDPAASRFTVGDIAHGLGNVCRFAGQSRRFYSVAEHCWHASFLVPHLLAFPVLMHDAAEAFVGDVTRPLKSLLPEYKAIEKRIDAVIAERFKIKLSQPAVEEITRADIAMLAAEQAAMMASHDDSWSILDGVTPPAIHFRYWSPEEAAWRWLERFEALAFGPAYDLEYMP
jgi:hypothetical protein